MPDTEPVVKAAVYDDVRRDASFLEKAGEGIRTLDVQLGKLAFYH